MLLMDDPMSATNRSGFSIASAACSIIARAFGPWPRSDSFNPVTAISTVSSPPSGESASMKSAADPTTSEMVFGVWLFRSGIHDSGSRVGPPDS